MTKGVRSMPLKYPSVQKMAGVSRYSRELPLRYAAVAAMTSGSFSKIAARRPPPKNVSRKMPAPNTTEMRRAISREFLARTGCPAPMFWATKVERADMNAMGMMERNTKSFSEMPIPAASATPRRLTMLVIIKKEMFTRKSCRAMGAPSAVIRRTQPRARKLSRVREKGSGRRRI